MASRGWPGNISKAKISRRRKGTFVDTKIDHNWPDPPLADIPGGLTSLNNFSARWQGTLTAPEDGDV